MSERKLEALAHPEHGRIPARRLLDCVFALSPDAGPILHHHIEEFDSATEGDWTIYTPNGNPPNADRERCQVIPPMVPEFPQMG